MLCNPEDREIEQDRFWKSENGFQKNELQIASYNLKNSLVKTLWPSQIYATYANIERVNYLESNDVPKIKIIFY